MTSEEAIAILEEEAEYLYQDDESYNREAFRMAIQALSQEPCDDAISREDAIKAVYGMTRYTGIDEAPYEYAEHVIADLPPVTSGRHKGRWIECDGYDGDTYYDCSECGESWTTIEGTPWDNGMNYCPNCGAKMESEVNNG